MFTAIMVKTYPLTSAFYVKAGRRAAAQKYLPAGKSQRPAAKRYSERPARQLYWRQHSLTLNGPLPTVKFVVEDLCATGRLLCLLFARRREIKREFFIHDDAPIIGCVVLKNPRMA